MSYKYRVQESMEENEEMSKIINMVRMMAYLFWEKEKINGVPFTKPVDLAKDPKMIDFLDILYEIAGFKEDGKSILDPEWFSDLHFNLKISEEIECLINNEMELRIEICNLKNRIEKLEKEHSLISLS